MIHSVLLVYCDSGREDCPLDGGHHGDEFVNTTKAAIRDLMRDRGWWVHGTRLFCPDCRRRMEDDVADGAED